MILFFAFPLNIPDLQREYKAYALIERGMRPKSYLEITRVLAALTQFADSENITAFQTQTIRAFLRIGRLEKGWSPKTFHIYRQYLASFFGWCKKQGYLKKNPVSPIEKPRLPQRLPRALSNQDARRVLFAAQCVPWRFEFQKARNATIIAIFLMTGVRLQELLNLTIADVDLIHRQLCIRQGKGRKDRLIPIHQRLVGILKAYFLARKQHAKQSTCLFPGVFSQKGLRVKDIYRLCQSVGKEAGVKFTPHMLRHTFAKEMIENDFPIFKLKEVLGHSCISTTQIYLSLSQDNLRKSFDLLNLY